QRAGPGGLGGGGGAEPPGRTKKPHSTASEQLAFLLIPASEAGKRFGEEAKEALEHLHLVNVPGQADLMFCRELTSLTGEDLERLLYPCRHAYHEHSLVPQTSPHARFDVTDWTPLDP